MINLYEALQTVLLTESTASDIVDAINNKYALEITYDDNRFKNLSNKIRYPKGVNPTGSRIIYPYCYGEDSRSGALVLRAFQIDNRATRRGAPKWKYFKLDNITSLKPIKSLPVRFEPKDMGYKNAPDFNYSGDELMSRVIAIFDIDYWSPLDRQKAINKFLARKRTRKFTSKQLGTEVPFASQQRKKNVYTSQPNSERYKQYAQNIDDTKNEIDRLNDNVWAQAEQERNMQNMMPKGRNIDPSFDEDEFDWNDLPRN